VIADCVRGLLAELDTAGEDWRRVARLFPELVRVRPGRWQGLAWIRPAVFLAGEDVSGTPLVLLLHEDGTWFYKGTRQGRL
jgi:hypothetical protein